MNSGHCRRTWCGCWHGGRAPAVDVSRAGTYSRARPVANGGTGTGATTPARCRALAEELAYKDGLLTWTEENVGEVFACIASQAPDERRRRKR